MGDDSPWIFKLNEKFEITEKIRIGDVSAAVKGKIPKSQKPDLEAMACFGDELLLFGSGSKSPQRDVLLKVNTITKAVSKYSLLHFYDTLCEASKITRNDLNIEAAAIASENILLFNRGKNIIFKINISELLLHAEGKSKMPPIELFHATLPVLNGLEAGFSGAALTPDGKQVLFTASVENTPNWIDDGEILGSFLGIIPLSELRDSIKPAYMKITDIEKNILKVKAEAVAVRSVDPTGKLQILIATDNDESDSELLEAELDL